MPEEPWFEMKRQCTHHDDEGEDHAGARDQRQNADELEGVLSELEVDRFGEHDGSH